MPLLPQERWIKYNVPVVMDYRTLQRNEGITLSFAKIICIRYGGRVGSKWCIRKDVYDKLKEDGEIERLTRNKLHHERDSHNSVGGRPHKKELHANHTDKRQTTINSEQVLSGIYKEMFERYSAGSADRD